VSELNAGFWKIRNGSNGVSDIHRGCFVARIEVYSQ
ncbi:MAG: hypothetical protein ACJAUZ_002289, partial [Flavobacteriaceae bacterium]